MQIMFRTLLLLFPLIAASCSDVGENEAQPEAKNISVTIGSGPQLDIESRTALDPDGITVRWVKGDKIALWAIGSDGTPQFQAQDFTLWHYNASYDNAKFTGNISQMPEGTYNYYAVSPKPLSTTGLKAHYEIPEIQDGRFNGACDIMVAQPVSGGALTEGDNSDKVNLSFSHKVHVLKITIPTNKMGLPISKLEITFPQPVAGQMTIDASDPAAAPEFTGTSNVLTLQFPEPIDANSTVYATIAPVIFTAAETIQFKAYTATKESLPAYMPGKVFAEAHTTPIRLTIPEIYRITRVLFSLDGDGTQTLGEKINTFTLTGPEGVDLGSGTNTRTFTLNADNEYDIAYEGVFSDNLSNQPFTVTFDSDNTLMSESFTMPQLIAEESNTIPQFTIPYLLDEDFSGASGFSGTAATGNAGGTELSDKGLPGWYAGARSEGYAGLCVNLRHYNNFGGPYESRLDSAPIRGIKDGKTVTIKVVFNADWVQNKSGNMNLLVGRTGTEHKLNSAINDQTTISMQNNGEASSSNIPSVRSVTINGVTNTESIAWKSSGQNKGVFNYEALYIDNVKVSITQ